MSIPHLGMFGNAMAAFLPPLARSITYSLGHVIVHGQTVLSDPSVFAQKGRHQLTPGPILWNNKQPSVFANPIRALIWDKSLIGSIPAETQEETWRQVSRVLLRDLDGPCFGPGTLLIHLRGGDAFGGSRFLLNHGQPPLAYYKLILRARPWSNVIIVHQGSRMPTLEPLKDFCKEIGLPSITQSHSLRDDIQTLLRAQVLVAGRGSFIPQIVGLSRCVREIFTYESGFGLALQRSGIAVHQVTDRASHYRSAILANNWRNTAEQRQLMVEYPGEHLQLRLDTGN